MYKEKRKKTSIFTTNYSLQVFHVKYFPKRLQYNHVEKYVLLFDNLRHSRVLSEVTISSGPTLTFRILIGMEINI